MAVVIHRMSGQINTGGFLFQQHQICFFHLCKLRDRNGRSFILFLEHGKQSHLAFQILFPGGCDGIHHGVIHGQKLTSVVTKAIHCAALNKVFHGTLVQFALPHPLDKIFQGFERTTFVTFLYHGANQAPSNVLHSAKAKADGIAFYRKVIFRVVDIRWKCGNSQLFTLSNIAGDLRG